MTPTLFDASTNRDDKMRFAFRTAAALAICAGTAAAQCKVASGSNEGRLLAFYSVPIVFSAATAPSVLAAGAIRIGFEAEYIPKPSSEIQHTGKCFHEKSEHTSLSPIFGRPRLTIGLPIGLSLEASYLPPIKIADAKPNLASFALSHTRHFAARAGSLGVDMMLRANATVGNVKGPITCPRSALQTTSSTAPCYGSNPSNDTFSPNMFGVDLIAGITPATSTFSFYGGVGANRIDPHFQVGFTDGAGGVDRTKVQLDDPLTRISLTAGVADRLASRFDLGAQLYSVPQDVTTFRVHAGMSFR
jgi:hypothetical protein